MNLDPKHVFLDYRSPYAWQSRTINFNKQIIKKLNHVQKCKFKQHQHQSKKVGNLIYQRNGQPPGLLHDISPITSSITPSLTSSSFDVREEVPFVKNAIPYSKKFQKNAIPSKMTRAYIESHNTAAGPMHRHNPAHQPAFPSGASRCPIHGSCSPSHLSYKHGGPNRVEISPSRFSSLNDIREYHQLSNTRHLSYSSPYLYPSGDSNPYPYPYPHPHGYYSSQLYMPGTCIPMQYFNPSMRQGLYPRKMALSTATYHHHQHHHRNRSFDYSNPTRLYAEEKSIHRRCKGHLVVLAIILTVITIGVIMGVILAVTIN